MREEMRILAEKLDGREYRETIDKEIRLYAKKNGLLIVHGASDDLIEFDGVFTDEAGAGNGTKVYIKSYGVVMEPECDCEYSEKWYKDQCKTACKIVVHQGGHPGLPGIDGKDIFWHYNADLDASSFTSFKIMEDGGVYCIGLIIDATQLPRKD